ncbi:MAG: aminotransferase class III-fold pyridoxal phosphate-dependent enzyme, partial [Alphaproteobacteria bacterium]|nr:aminotransferase class III-fold pyridoxal phosphate-dependent enzyme [Alphaproteobacteria bacterium]
MVDYVLGREGDVAAVIAEPMRAVPVVPPPGYWQAVRAACDRHGALLIFDEIQTGMGRTGKLFVYEWLGITPDIMPIGISVSALTMMNGNISILANQGDIWRPINNPMNGAIRPNRNLQSISLLSIVPPAYETAGSFDRSHRWSDRCQLRETLSTQSPLFHHIWPGTTYH